jgi:hydroxymethylglutaryl-CoA reductase (NADPH)
MAGPLVGARPGAVARRLGVLRARGWRGVGGGASRALGAGAAGEAQVAGSAEEDGRPAVAANVPQHKLESVLGTYAGVQARRELIADELDKRDASGAKADALFKVPAQQGDFDVAAFYEQVYGSNCENVIGFVPLPVGVIGPLRVNGEELFVPLATTEGALLASTNRGARALREAGGVAAVVTANGMTRSPVLGLRSAVAASEFKRWVESPERWEALRAKFQETTRFGRLESVRATQAGRYVYLRFRAETGDAMGMNMVGKGVNHIVAWLLETYPAAAAEGLSLLSLSSNMCTDKKPSAVNWVLGRGKSVVAEALLPRAVVENVLKTTVADLVRLNTAKNLVGSALAGSIGGNNAHASNLVTALFLASGQDPAQNVESSNCMVLMEALDGGEAIHVSVTMPSIEVGTLGGGTSLGTQRAVLEMLGVSGSNPAAPGANASKLATIVAATVLAGELSLNAALASGHLISAHMDLNRKPTTGAATQSESQGQSDKPNQSHSHSQGEIQPVPHTAHGPHARDTSPIRSRRPTRR